MTVRRSTEIAAGPFAASSHTAKLRARASTLICSLIVSLCEQCKHPGTGNALHHCGFSSLLVMGSLITRAASTEKSWNWLKLCTRS
jgi:hypothetical protein